MGQLICCQGTSGTEASQKKIVKNEYSSGHIVRNVIPFGSDKVVQITGDSDEKLEPSLELLSVAPLSSEVFSDKFYLEKIRLNPHESPISRANSYRTPVTKSVIRRQTSEPFPTTVRLTYSHMNWKKQTIEVEECLIQTLSSPAHMSVSESFDLKRKTNTNSKRASHCSSAEKFEFKSKKTVRFDDRVTIHTIESSTDTPVAMPETYKIIIYLQEIWSELDQDGDGFLSMKELHHFCSELWEPDDCDDEKIMVAYAKAMPKKGMNFNEWCSLVSDEDPDLVQFVGELHKMFVEGGFTSGEEVTEETGDDTTSS